MGVAGRFASSRPVKRVIKKEAYLASSSTSYQTLLIFIGND